MKKCKNCGDVDGHLFKIFDGIYCYECIYNKLDDDLEYRAMAIEEYIENNAIPIKK